MGKLADWKCHKTVKAGKILYAPLGLTEVVIEDIDGLACKIPVAPELFARGTPSVGDYIVVYEDGYVSWSPAKAFEEGYTKQDEQVGK